MAFSLNDSQRILDGAPANNLFFKIYSLFFILAMAIC